MAPARRTVGQLAEQKKVGARVREARRALGWSAERLAMKIGITANHVYVIERGESAPNDRTMLKLCKALGKTREWLLGEKSV